MEPSELIKTIYADPPWPERGGGKIKRGADRHYPLMTVHDIASYLEDTGIDKLIAPDAHLYLWTTNNYLPDALHVIDAWAFRYITTITWNKQGNIGLGQYFRGTTERCLFAVRGSLPYKRGADGKRMQGRTGFTAPKGRHSAKPSEMREMIERVSYPPHLELFARETFPSEDWRFMGNEI